jgi:peptidoglycan/LPS O-acetylase OafA/YrhL
MEGIERQRLKRGNSTMNTPKAIAKPPPSPSPSASQEGQALPASRWYYLDWLRVFALLTVFLYHTTMIFSYGDWWFIKNDHLNWAMTLFDRIIELWGMPLFFVISAVGIYYSLNQRKNGQFLAERFKRLFIPLIFGIFVLSPPQVYIERITHGQFTGSFWQFLPHYFDGWYGFGGNFAWTGLHLWFLFLLLLFSVLLLPLLRYLKQANSAAIVLQKLPWLQGELFLVVAVVCTGIIEALVNLQPDGLLAMRNMGGWSPLTYLVGFFLCGYLLALNPKALSSFERNRVSTLLLGVCTALLYLILVEGYGYSSYSIPFSFLRALNAWLWLATLLGFARRYLNVHTPLLAEANQAQLPFYILHHPVIIIVAFFLLTWNFPAPAKFVLIALVSFGIIIGLYQGLIRPLPPLRFLFGMKAREKRTLQVSSS